MTGGNYWKTSSSWRHVVTCNGEKSAGKGVTGVTWRKVQGIMKPKEKRGKHETCGKRGKAFIWELVRESRLGFSLNWFRYYRVLHNSGKIMAAENRLQSKHIYLSSAPSNY